MRLKKLRESCGLTQIALARKLNVAPYMIDKWERGVGEPPPSAVRKLKELEQNVPRLRI